MQSRRIFLVIGALGVSLCFTLLFFLALIKYFSLPENTRAQIAQWQIVEKGQKFVLQADYSFESRGKMWEGSYQFADLYMSEAAALGDLKVAAKQSWLAWYSSSNPSNSALEKNFPTNLLVRTLICWGVAVYFFCLNKRIRSI